MERHERASDLYEATGLQILELAQNVYSLYVTENPQEPARLVKTLLSNCTFDRGTLCPTYRKPFDLFAKAKLEIGSPVWTTFATGSSVVRLDSALTARTASRPRVTFTTLVDRSASGIRGRTTVGVFTDISKPLRTLSSAVDGFTLRSTSCISSRCHRGTAHCVQLFAAFGTAPSARRHRIRQPRPVPAPQLGDLRQGFQNAPTTM
jgi:hypothetical protein